MTTIGDRSDTELRPAAGRAPDQICYIVEDLEKGVRTIGQRLGIKRWLGWTYDAAYLPKRVFRGQPGNFESHGVIAEFGPSVEIVAPLSGDSVFSEFLAAHGPGLHHLGYFVPSVADERARLNALGLHEVQYGGGHGINGDGHISFFESTDGTGPYLEFIEPPEKRYPNHFIIELD